MRLDTWAGGRGCWQDMEDGVTLFFLLHERPIIVIPKTKYWGLKERGEKEGPSIVRGQNGWRFRSDSRKAHLLLCGRPSCLARLQPQGPHKHHHHLMFPMAVLGHFLHPLSTFRASWTWVPSSVLQIHQDQNTWEKPYKPAITVARWLGLLITFGLFIQNLLKPNWILWGLLGTEALLCPPFLDYRK